MGCPFRMYGPWPIEWRCIRPFAHTEPHDVRGHNLAGLVNTVGVAAGVLWWALSAGADALVHRHRET